MHVLTYEKKEGIFDRILHGKQSDIKHQTETIIVLLEKMAFVMYSHQYVENGKKCRLFIRPKTALSFRIIPPPPPQGPPLRRNLLRDRFLLPKST